MMGIFVKLEKVASKPDCMVYEVKAQSKVIYFKVNLKSKFIEIYLDNDLKKLDQALNFNDLDAKVQETPNFPYGLLVRALMRISKCFDTNTFPEKLSWSA